MSRFSTSWILKGHDCSLLSFIAILQNKGYYLSFPVWQIIHLQDQCDPFKLLSIATSCIPGKIHLAPHKAIFFAKGEKKKHLGAFWTTFFRWQTKRRVWLCCYCDAALWAEMTALFIDFQMRETVQGSILVNCGSRIAFGYTARFRLKSCHLLACGSHVHSRPKSCTQNIFHL